MKTKKPTVEYNLVVSYDANFWFEHPNADSVFEKIVGDGSWGSGLGLGSRDLSFWFKTAKKCNAVEKKLLKAKKLKKLPKFKITIDVVEN